MKNKYLTWNELADLYDKKTGGHARCLPMDSIYAWAVKQKEIRETEEGLILIEEYVPERQDNSRNQTEDRK